jgi:hypothetical protein
MKMTTVTLRAYYLLTSQYALENLRHRRLKIAQLDDLNDPFDLWALAQPDPNSTSTTCLSRKIGS